MRIIPEKLEELSVKELNEKYFSIISTLNNAGINPDLSRQHWKDRERKCKQHHTELKQLDEICDLLKKDNPYKGFLNDSIGGFD